VRAEAIERSCAQQNFGKICAEIDLFHRGLARRCERIGEAKESRIMPLAFGRLRP